MNLKPIFVHGDENFLVFDNFLPKEEKKLLFNQIKLDIWEMTSPHNDKFWHITDGNHYRSSQRWNTNYPFHDNADLWFEKLSDFLKVQKKENNFLEDYKKFSCRAHAYPRGSKLPWHTDQGVITYSYYLHDTWQINWGGATYFIPIDKSYKQSLTIQPGSKHYDSYKGTLKPVDLFEQKEKYSPLMQKGLGYFIYPKPNRLVFINNNVAHGMSRVDEDAGEHIRISLTGGIVL